MLIDKFKLYEYIPGLYIIIGVLISILTGIQSLTYIAIFYWCVFRSDLVPISLLVSTGLIYDSLCSHFLGEEAFLYITLMSIVYMDRRFLLHRDFNYLWLNIVILIAVIGIGKWLLALKLGLIFSVQQQLLDALIGVFSFPIYIRIVAPIYSKFATL
jgi:rod shape-determining protein MreD